MLLAPLFFKRWFWFFGLPLGVVSMAAEARTVNFAEISGLVAGVGSADFRDPLAKVLSSLQPGDTLLVPPGEYRVVLGKAGLAVPAGVTILGQGGKSVFALVSEGGEKPGCST